MAIYHLSVKPVSRSSGRSATAAAAYRAAERIEDRRTGELHDYTRKGGVEHAGIVLPQGTNWRPDRAALWNAAELAEKRKDACVAREYEVALPAELSSTERRRLVADFAQEMANREGCAVDIAIHAPGRGGDNRNHHAHLLRTTRKAEAEGLGEKLDTEKAGRNRKADLEAVRARWAELVNERLRQHGIEASIDHRSLEAQGIDRDPTQHKGPAVTGMERRGKSTEVGQRLAEEANARLFAAHEMGRIERELAQADRSILDLSGAIHEREERRREAERPPFDSLAGFRASVERAELSGGLALDVAKAQLAVAHEFQADGKHPPHHIAAIMQEGQQRAFTHLQEQIQAKAAPDFAAKRPEERQDTQPKELPAWTAKARRAAAAHGVKLGGPELDAMPIEQQAKAFDTLQNRLVKARQDRIDRINARAMARLARRTKAEESVKAKQPEMPRGILAGFRMKAYDEAVGAWRKAHWAKEKLKTDAENLVRKLTREAVSALAWGKRTLENAEPDLDWRVSRYRLDEKDRQEKERKALAAQREQKRQAKQGRSRSR